MHDLRGWLLLFVILWLPVTPVVGQANDSNRCDAEPTYLPSRGIDQGEQAVVLNAVTMYDAPPPDARTEVAQLTAGTTVSVLDGPVCRQTRNQNLRGWFVQVGAEGSVGYVTEYTETVGVLTVFLEPAGSEAGIRYFNVSAASTTTGTVFPGGAATLSWDVAGAEPATPETISLNGQVFERGRMFWLSDRREIYALLDDGRLFVVADTWQGEDLPTETPPAGLLQPRYGFGKVWLENPAIRDGLGWALAEESTSQAVMTTVNADCSDNHYADLTFGGVTFHFNYCLNTWTSH